MMTTLALDFRAVFETLADAVVIADERGSVTFANRAAEHLLGYSPGALLGTALGSLLPVDARDSAAALLRPARGATVTPEALCVSVLTAHGNELPIEVRASSLVSAGAEVTVWVMRGGRDRVDLAGRVRVSDSLTALADAFVQMAVRPAVEGVARVACETLVNRLDGVAARVWLYDAARERLALQAWAGVSPAVDGASTVGEHLASYGAGLAEAIADRQSRTVRDVAITSSDALPAWFLRDHVAGYVIHPLVFGDQLVGAIAYFARSVLTPEMLHVIAAFARHTAVALHDLHQQAQSRRQIEALAREAHARTGEFEAIVSNMPDAVLVARRGAITFANRTALRMFGVASAATLMVPIEEFPRVANVRRPDGTAMPSGETVLARVLNGGVITGQEERITNSATGRDVWVQVSGAPLREGSGEIQGAVVVAAEITRLKELEQSKDEWLAIAAHELRTPLTPIMVHLQMAQRRLHMGREIGPEVFDRALEQVKRLSRLVNGLLDVTRLQAGQLELVVEEVDLCEIAEAIVDRVRHSAPRHTLVLDVAPTPVCVRGDRARLDEVFTAMVDNAVKYSPEGGEVWMSVSRRGDEATVSVRDEGIGIGPDERAQIFERYFRAGSVPQTQYGGLGLGLWIAGKVTQKHGGRMELDSALGKGSTFRVVLPSVHAPASVAVPAPSESRRARVLVVDDDLAVLEAVEVLLGEDGYDVHVASSGPEAIREVRVWRPDVMLLDLRMPGMDGWEVRRQLEADPDLASIPVVLVSADRDARKRASGMNVQGFVAKPFDLEELEHVVSALVGKGPEHTETGRAEPV